MSSTVSISSDLERLLEAVEIVTPTRVRVGARLREVEGPSPLFAPSSTAAAQVGAPEARLWRALADEIYSGLYARARAAAAPPPDPGALRDHLVSLARANSSSDTWEPGWSVRAIVENGRVAVAGLGLVFLVRADEVRPESGTLAVGAPCRVRIPAEMRAVLPGFYCATGEAASAAPEAIRWRVRLYWHLLPAAAPVWVEMLTRGLNRREIPFQLKVVADPRFYLRADAGVLSLEPERYEAALPVVEETYDAVGAQLRPEVPGLTHPLAPGLSVAEGAADGSSFGAHRCELIAGALVPLGPGAVEPAHRVAAVAAAFRAAGLDAAHPYRAAGSTTGFPPLSRFDMPVASPPAAGPATRRGESAPSPPSDPLAAAAAIGDRLCHVAYRGDGRANWLGRLYTADPETGAAVAAFGALGPGLYGGTAGVALFLAELASVTGENGHRDTALAAVRQALTAVESEPDRTRPVGFYDGQLGIGWAARRVAAKVDDEETAVKAERLILRIARDLPGEHRADLIEGNAGAILALLRLHEEEGDSLLLEAATRLGQELLPPEAAPEAPWADAGRPPLTGFSHGAAGIGLALLELASATGDSRFRDAADGCFAYEAASFDETRRNWPDYRMIPVDEAGRLAWAPGFMIAWCHGAPGIALSRLRAMEVDSDRAPSYEPAARAGLATTLESIESALGEAAPETSLCHGLAGAAEISGVGASTLDDPALAESAARAMERVAALCTRDRPDAESRPPVDPSLMIGEAGVGYALLRFSDPARFGTLLLPGAHRQPRARPAGRPAGVPHDRRETTVTEWEGTAS